MACYARFSGSINRSFNMVKGIADTGVFRFTPIRKIDLQGRPVIDNILKKGTMANGVPDARLRLFA